MEKRYFVKFVGDKNVTIAVAKSDQEARVLKRNQYEETTPQFYNWVKTNTSKI